MLTCSWAFQKQTPIPAEYNGCRSGPGTLRGPGVIVISPGPRIPARCPRDGPHQFGWGESVSRKSERTKKMWRHLILETAAVLNTKLEDAATFERRPIPKL